MRGPTFLTGLALAAACAAPRGGYAPEDPLSGARPPQTVYEAGASSGTRSALFAAVLPAGYTLSDAVLTPPVAAILRRDTAFGETSIVVERYGRGGAPGGRGGPAVPREDFAAHLSEGAPPPATRHTFRGAALTAYHDLRFRVSVRRVGPDDPWRDALGEGVEPPRLSALEGRRFLLGGEAYRLYRCEKLGAWDMLADYRRAQTRGKADTFLQSHTPEERRLVSACFGTWMSRAMGDGAAVPAVRSPSLGALRAMAREEWERGVSTVEERECVVVLDAPGGFWALRLRAPADAFDAEHPAFVAFAASFRGSNEGQNQKFE